MDDNSWITGKELAQRAVISHNNNVQRMDIAIDVQAKGQSGIWVFPVPAEAQEILLDVSKGFAVPEGTSYLQLKNDIAEVSRAAFVALPAGFLFGSSGRLFILRALVSTFFGSSDIEYDLTSYRSFSKLGLESEVVQARSAQDLFSFFSSRRLEIPEADKNIWEQYHHDSYSFIVSRFLVSDSVRDRDEKTLSLQVTFPTQKAFFPLKPSKTYESAVIPLEIYIDGYRSVSVPKSLRPKLKTDYLFDEEKKEITYTKVFSQAPASLFTDDMWFGETSTYDAGKLLVENLFILNSDNFGFIAFPLFLLLLVYVFYKVCKNYGFLKLFFVLTGGLAMLYFFRREESGNRNLKFISKFIVAPLVILAAYGDVLVLVPGGLMYLHFSAKSGHRAFVATIFSHIEGSLGGVLLLAGVIIYLLLILRFLWTNR